MSFERTHGLFIIKNEIVCIHTERIWPLIYISITFLLPSEIGITISTSSHYIFHHTSQKYSLTFEKIQYIWPNGIYNLEQMLNNELLKAWK